MGTPLAGSGYTTAAQEGGAAGGCVDTSNIAPADPSTLPACCADGQSGAAHCVPADKVPGAIASQLGTCSGGVCVPDPFIKDPTTVPKSCASIGGAPGVCLSVCVPQVAQFASLLPKDVCEDDEKCAPCNDPTKGGAPTGACDIGKAGACGGGGSEAGAAAASSCPYDGPPLLDPSTLPSCDPQGGAHCLATNMIPDPKLLAQLAPCATGACVPDNFIRAGGQVIPPSCRSVGSAEGRCLHQVIPQIAAQKDTIPVSTCAPYERCAPCTDPLTRQDTGACHQSCDPGPREAPVIFGPCCDGRGKCIPQDAVPLKDKHLQRGTCAGRTDQCVADEMIPLQSFRPAACQAAVDIPLLGTLTYAGVCLSTCLNFATDLIEAVGIQQGTCDGLHKCAPCKNPVTGAATGAPGCGP